MPRVTNAPRATSGTFSQTPFKGSPMKIPLNDDKQEKAKRQQSRQAQYESQMDQIRAAATPIRRRRSLVGADSSPQTPNEDPLRRISIGGNAVTPMKRVPILANFEEWMKMATDNKINATNAWNFALIDYFHDMSLLKEGDGVNFQKASCTLDGCVKIYTSRVDGVATETGRMLSSLADSGNKKRKGDDEGGEDGEDEEEEGEDGVKKKPKKKTQKTAEATLATSFAQLQLKKMELEFSVDPLFKKASADFDEGGARGLLLNHLAIDNEGRIVFDSSDDPESERRKDQEDTTIEAQGKEGEGSVQGDAEVEQPDGKIDIASLGAKFFPDLAIIDEQDICPSLKSFELGDTTGSLDLPFLKAPPDDWKNQDKGSQHEEDARSGIFLDDDNAAGFDDDDGPLGGFDLPPDIGFGEGGEAWAKEAILEPQKRVQTLPGMEDGEYDEAVKGEVGGYDPDSTQYGVKLSQGKEDEQENILSYFDEALKKQWAGPEHWKIKRIKENTKDETPKQKRKEKEPFEIDFGAPMTQAMADMLYTPAASNSAISLPKSQWKSKTRNLLPDDKHFNSRQLLRLFLKPKARLGSKKAGLVTQTQSNNLETGPEGEVDETYWAQDQGPVATEEEPAPEGDYDANFFQDDGLGQPGEGIDEDDDDIFADAREMFSPPIDDIDGAPAPLGDVLNGSQEAAFGAQLVAQSRRVRPEYVQYARVAKKVDVRRLKEELWRGIGYEEASSFSTALEIRKANRVFQSLPPQTPSKLVVAPAQQAEDGSLKFTDVMNNLQGVYPKQAMADISTSFCFICLLHLANEKGLVLNNEPGFTDLGIRRDLTFDSSTAAEG
ncbi:MAG: hypothetical protein M1820_006528 [Bogoriella megaspora]|nr:MAG: hypothetical protein M1820_006528 [Bogoriella megaspora]